MKMNKPEKQLVSVVITTKNEEKNIRPCLESIKNQTWDSIEIIVVDNASTDNTKKIAREYTNKVFDKGPERSAQRNYGMIVVASGDYVIYIDADMLLAPSLIERCVKFIQKSNSVALHISETVLGKNYFSQVRRFERGFYDGTSVDGARFFDRYIFVKAGGFDEKLFRKGSGEDWDIDKEVKKYGSISLLPKKEDTAKVDKWPLEKFVSERGVAFDGKYVGIFHNESEFKLGVYLKKKLYYSQGFDGYIAKWGAEDIDIRRQFGLSYRYFGVFTENGKWKRLVRNPKLTFGMYFLRFCVGVVFLMKKSVPQ